MTDDRTVKNAQDEALLQKLQDLLTEEEMAHFKDTMRGFACRGFEAGLHAAADLLGERGLIVVADDVRALLTVEQMTLAGLAST